MIKEQRKSAICESIERQAELKSEERSSLAKVKMYKDSVPEEIAVEIY